MVEKFSGIVKTCGGDTVSWRIISVLKEVPKLYKPLAKISVEFEIRERS